MIPITLQQAADWSRGTCTGGGNIDHITIDSRTARSGSLFIALKGEKADGHDFVPEVLAKGGFALVRPGMFEDPRVIQVPDPLVGLQDLARGYLRQFSLPIVAITGSNGKTSTKDMITRILEEKYVVHATVGNYNNEIGLPLTILGLEKDHQVLVVEMGMRGSGQIKALTTICPPSIGVITNIGPVHLELLGTIENIAKAKGELLEALGPNGVAVLNGDDTLLRQQASRMQGKIVFFGEGSNNDLVIEIVKVNEKAHPTFRIKGATITGEITLGVAGLHNVMNACAAVAVGLELDIPLHSCIQALADISLSKMRLEVQENTQGAFVVNDAYNASPASMQAALDTLAHMECGGKRIAILGEMRELGPISESAHEQIGTYAGRICDELVFIGRWAEAMRRGAKRGRVYATVEDLLHEGIVTNDGDLVLVKASRGLRLERVVDLLMKGRESHA